MAGKGSRVGGYRSALHSRDLRRLLTGQIISNSGSWAYNVALAAFLYDRTHSAAWVAAGTLGRFVPSLLLSAYGGVVAERFERVALMTWVNVVATIVQAALAAVIVAGGPVGLALVLAAATSIVGLPYQPAVAAVIPQVVGEDDLAAANGASATIDNLVVVVGPALGAVLLIAAGPGAVVVVNAASFAVAALVVRTIRVRSKPSDVTAGGRAGALRQVADGFKAVLGSGAAALFVGFSVVASFVYGTDTVLFVAVSSSQLHTGTSGYGYLLAGLGVGGLAGATVLNRIAAKPRLAYWIVGAMGVYCLPTALLVVVHSPLVAFAIEAVRGAGTLVVDTLAITALQRSVPRDMVARVFGAFFALVIGAISLGALVAPLVLRAGLHPALLVFGLGVPLVCLLGLPALRRNDDAIAAGAAILAPRVATLERLDLFASATRAALERLAADAEELSVVAGTVVVAEGERADAFYVVERGLLDVSAVGEVGGAQRHLRDLGDGTYFGEIGLLAGGVRTATVRATSGCELLKIGGEELLAALTDLSASPSLLEGARSRMQLTHPSRAGLLKAPGTAPGAV